MCVLWSVVCIKFMLYVYALCVCCSMACPWSDIDPTTEYQGEWWCMCEGNGSVWKHKALVITSWMYTEVGGLGWFMCGSCQGIWQHTHHSPSPEDGLDGGEVHHICKSLPTYPCQKSGKPVRLGLCRTGLPDF